MARRQIDVENLTIQVREVIVGRERQITLQANFKATTPGQPTDDWDVTIHEMTPEQIQRLFEQVLGSIALNPQVRELSAEKDYDVDIGRRQP